jgi:hypothetical protein
LSAWQRTQGPVGAHQLRGATEKDFRSATLLAVAGGFSDKDVSDFTGRPDEFGWTLRNIQFRLEMRFHYSIALMV